MPSTALCLICRYPHDIWCRFLSSFPARGYDVFVMADCLDPSYTREWQERYPSLVFCTVPPEDCRARGYTNMNFLMNKIITGWEKALYAFRYQFQQYNHVWFFEDDVFIPTVETLVALDHRYPHADLLSNDCVVNTTGEQYSWHWSHIDIRFPPPYYAGMMCIVRMSARLVACIDDYARQHGALFFLEAMFPTLARHHHLLHESPREMSTVVFRRNYYANDIDSTRLYHPVKQLEHHVAFRETQKMK